MKKQPGVLRQNEDPSWLVRVWMRPALSVLVLISALALVAAIGFFGHELDLHIKSLESWVAQVGVFGMLVFIVLVVIATSIFLPESLFGVAAGVLFGVVWGTAIMLTANVLAAVLQYGLAHQLLRGPIQRKFGTGKVSTIVRRVASSDNFSLQLLLRVMPVNQTAVGYLLGAAGVRFLPFLVASAAVFPSIVIEVYLGHTGKHLALISTSAGHTSWQHGAAHVAGLFVLILGVSFASRAAYKQVLRTTEVVSDEGPS